MFDNFKYSLVPLKDIALDVRNPRLVTLKPLKDEAAIIEYLFNHENLASFLQKIAAEGRNAGAERPYIVSEGGSGKYVVIEGNTRIATYKLLTGLSSPPAAHKGKIPAITAAQKKLLQAIDCTIAPDREALLPIMASAHFGLGDKSKWGYLGSRKAVFDEWKSGHSIGKLAEIFNQKKGKIRDLIIEYSLFLEALKFKWTTEDREILEDPAVEFNPPVRFLQGTGHKEKVGVVFDRDNLAVSFINDEAKSKFRHLVRKLVIAPEKGLGATAGYDQVFADYKSQDSDTGKSDKNTGKSDKKGEKSPGGKGGEKDDGGDGKAKSPNLKPGALFNYPVSIHSQLVIRLAVEAKNLNCSNFPASGTFLMRNFIEAILTEILSKQKTIPANSSLESLLNLAQQQDVTVIDQTNKKVLSEFKKNHLNYLNLGAHANIIPNADRLFSARDCIDLFVKKYL